MKYSSSSPRTRPPRAITPVGPPATPRPERTSRTLIMVSSTMVPTLSRYCWATRGWLMR
jgi:hypothetical protein